jgi:hypothetical protein
MRDYIKRNAVLLAIGISCAAWACGDDDDDDDGTGGTAGKGGSAGTAGSGKGGTGGTAGGKGGTGGTAGGKGGTGGTAGGGTGGGDAGAGAGGDDGGVGGAEGGSSGSAQGGAGAGNDTAGAGGVAGAAAGAGGQGGDDAAPGGAGAGGAAAGAAGAGGAPAEATLTELCTTICGRVDAFASTASCRDEDCVTLCADYPLVGDAGIDGLYHDMVSCITANLDATADFACADSTTTGSKWSTVVSGSNECDTETCAWTCSGAYAIDPDLYTGGCACDG